MAGWKIHYNGSFNREIIYVYSLFSIVMFDYQRVNVKIEHHPTIMDITSKNV